MKKGNSSINQVKEMIAQVSRHLSRSEKAKYNHLKTQKLTAAYREKMLKDDSYRLRCEYEEKFGAYPVNKF